ncbi:hypothetical protein GLOTRDRAFT_129737 [Gloeophyllum trabeum ATCC 11539]|uniref:Uncharacterized protein n=1 Tax=Gloeophyllum trabeum (strain ATCC 11539 / FP-39264 / Madison 617) TaxID=670483 RepID=S7RRA7_GLOTA|nr:uncharacterized protein GLOTRDRAFT_129737 [Gloeophyllum trabeum ATCC 11539]EPQ55464.1 hypothetical protein GLOTRDRAFT_129737 [Gloeophyllum trabeum ATCC 11539]
MESLTNDEKQQRLTEELQILQIMPRLRIALPARPRGVAAMPANDRKLKLLDDIAMAVSTGESGKTVAVVVQERDNRAVHFTLAVNGLPGPRDKAAAEQFFGSLLHPEEQFEVHMMNTIRSYAMPRIERLAKKVTDASEMFLGGGFIDLLEDCSWGPHKDQLPGFEFMKTKLARLEGASMPTCLAMVFSHLHESAAKLSEPANESAGGSPSHAKWINSIILFAYYLARASVFSILASHPECKGNTRFLSLFRYRLSMLGRYFGCLERLKALVHYAGGNISWEWYCETGAGIVNDYPVTMRRSHLEIIRSGLPQWMDDDDREEADMILGKECPKYKKTVLVSTHPALRLILGTRGSHLQLIGCSDGICLTTGEWIEEYNLAKKTEWRFGPSLRESDPSFALTHIFSFEDKVYDIVENMRGLAVNDEMRPRDHDY